MNAQEIADRLKGMTHGAFKVSPAGCLARGWVCLAYGSDWMSAPPEEFLAFCRAVVERVDGYPEDYKHGEPVCEAW